MRRCETTRVGSGELFPRPGFIVTNMTRPSRSVVLFYDKRGTAEQWIKEGQQATQWARLSCHRFRANEVRPQWSVPAYNLGNLWRRLGLPPRIKSWSLRSLQQRLVKTGGRLIKHARYDWLLPSGCSTPLTNRGTCREFHSAFLNMTHLISRSMSINPPLFSHPAAAANPAPSEPPGPALCGDYRRGEVA